MTISYAAVMRIGTRSSGSTFHFFLTLFLVSGLLTLFPITIDLTCSRNGLRTQSSLWFYSTKTCKAPQQCPHNPISASFNANRMLHPSLSPSHNHLVPASQDIFFLPIRALGLWLGWLHSFIWALGPRAPSYFQRTIGALLLRPSC